VRTISSLLHAPGSGRRLFATASLAALAVTGVSFNSTPTTTAAPSLDKAQLAAATAAATPAPAETPGVKLAAGDTSVFSGRTATLTATVTHAGGAAFAAEAVQLQQAAAHGTWLTIATKKTAGNGRAAFSVKVNATGNYRVAVPAVKNVASAATSGKVTVTKVDPGALIVSAAAKFAGRPYVFGAAGPRYFDCSGLVLYVYKHVVGMNLPHSAALQDHYGVRISRAQAKPGDLIFFRTSSGYVHHVAIYAGGNLMWEAPHTGSVVHKVKIWSNAVEFRRLVQH
jgi:cell wall-associated NlpC family hydrolase